MTEYHGHCMRCKKKVKIDDPNVKNTRPGVNQVCGMCHVCKKTKVCTFVSAKKK